MNRNRFHAWFIVLPVLLADNCDKLSSEFQAKRTIAMPRLFTGFEIPANVASVLKANYSGLQGARWIAHEDYHVTLCFIGDIDLETAEEIHQVLNNQENIASPVLKIGKLAVFGGKKLRSLHVEIEPDETLLALHSAQKRLLQSVGVAFERRKYMPHVTLARLRNVSPGAAAQFIEESVPLKPVSFTPNRFVLFSCRSARGGGPYVVEEGYDFST